MYIYFKNIKNNQEKSESKSLTNFVFCSSNKIILMLTSIIIRTSQKYSVLTLKIYVFFVLCTKGEGKDGVKCNLLTEILITSGEQWKDLQFKSCWDSSVFICCLIWYELLNLLWSRKLLSYIGRWEWNQQCIVNLGYTVIVCLNGVTCRSAFR